MRMDRRKAETGPGEVQRRPVGEQGEEQAQQEKGVRRLVVVGGYFGTGAEVPVEVGRVVDRAEADRAAEGGG